MTEGALKEELVKFLAWFHTPATDDDSHLRRVVDSYFKDMSPIKDWSL